MSGNRLEPLTKALLQLDLFPQPCRVQNDHLGGRKLRSVQAFANLVERKSVVRIKTFFSMNTIF